jgi:hypothetical protein
MQDLQTHSIGEGRVIRQSQKTQTGGKTRDAAFFDTWRIHGMLNNRRVADLIFLPVNIMWIA